MQVMWHMNGKAMTETRTTNALLTTAAHTLQKHEQIRLSLWM
jgi:hypothetical protein